MLLERIRSVAFAGDLLCTGLCAAPALRYMPKLISGSRCSFMPIVTLYNDFCPSNEFVSSLPVPLFPQRSTPLLHSRLSLPAPLSASSSRQRSVFSAPTSSFACLPHPSTSSQKIHRCLQTLDIPIVRRVGRMAASQCRVGVIGSRHLQIELDQS